MTTPTITVYFLITEAVQRAQLAAGEDPVQRQSAVAYGPDSPHFHLALELASISPAGVPIVEIGHRGWDPDAGAGKVPIATGNALSERLILLDTATPDLQVELQAEKERREAVAAFEARAAERRAAADRERMARAEQARLQKRDQRRREIEAGIERLGPAASASIRARLEADGPTQALAAQVVRALNAAEEAERHAAMGDWIRLNGSDHLKTCFDEGYECRSVYMAERIKLELPGWRPIWTRTRGVAVNAPRNPRPAATTLLKEVREEVPSAQLRYVTVERRGAVECRPGEKVSKFSWDGWVLTTELEGQTLVYSHAARNGHGRVPVETLNLW